MQDETNQMPETVFNKELRSAEWAAKRRREDILEACLRAVECLERFAADARRAVERAGQTSTEAARIRGDKDFDPMRLVSLPGEVASQSAWGAANASSELSGASRMAAEYMHALGVIEGLKGDAR